MSSAVWQAWRSRLGPQPQCNFPVQLSAVRSDGGPIAAVDVVIERLYPTRFLVPVNPGVYSADLAARDPDAAAAAAAPVRCSMSEEEHEAYLHLVEARRADVMQAVSQQLLGRAFCPVGGWGSGAGGGRGMQAAATAADDKARRVCKEVERRCAELGIDEDAARGSSDSTSETVLWEGWRPCPCSC